MFYKCNVCNVYTYDSEKGDGDTGIEAGLLPDNFPDEWRCPVCKADKTHLKPTEGMTAKSSVESGPAAGEKAKDGYLSAWRRQGDIIETHMEDIHEIAETGESVVAPMRTTKKVISWDDILFKGAQLAKIPLNKYVQVNTKTVIGPKARQPLVLETPIYVTHMSFGALSREIKIALARGSASVRTAIASGEGGILKEEKEAAYKYIFEYVPNRYSIAEGLKADAIEIKVGQSAKPGMGGQLPGEKVTKEIAEIRGFPEGKDIISPASFEDVQNKNSLRDKVDWLREKSEGKPIGIKIAAGHLEEDLSIAVHARPDFITIDGRPGATAASPKFVKDSASIPTLFALYRARKFFDENRVEDISLVITGGLRISSDFAKALALGADAIAIGTSALIAAACQQYRICHTGRCPVGVTTQNPELRRRIDIDKSAKRLENFLRVSTQELKDFARLTGNSDVHKLSIKDLCTTNSEISEHTEIKHV
jgi:glutamate synthase domain-containing protein 2